MKTKFRPKKGKMYSNQLDARLKGIYGVDYEATTILELVSQFDEKSKKNRARAFQKAVLNEKLYHNLQSSTDYEISTRKLATQLNYFTNLVLTAASRLQEDRPYVKAYPTHQTDRDVAALADAYFGHLFRSNNVDHLSMEFALYLLLHAQTYNRITWDPDAGSLMKEPSRDPTTGQPMVLNDGTPLYDELGPSGDVVWDRFSIFDVSYPGENPEDSEWCTLSKWVSEDEARQMFRDLEYSENVIDSLVLMKKVPELLFQDEQEELVEVKEVWIRPGGTLKDGLFAKIIGENVAQYMPFPYNHGMIPVVAWKYSPLSNSRWATSPADHAAALQLYINDLQEMKLDMVYRTADFTKLMAMTGIAEFMNEENSVIECKNITEVTQGAHWVSPPPPPELLITEQNDAISKMHEVFGLNEMLSGRDTAKAGTSAKAIAYLQKQDSQKHAACMRNFELFMELSVKQSLALFSQYAKVERQIQVLGEGSEMYIESLKGADLDETDVIVEPSSGIERFAAQQAAEVEKELQMGMISPAEGKDRMDSGLPMSLDTHQQMEAARKVVHDAAQGHGVQIPPGVSVKLLNVELQKAKSQYDFQMNPGLQQLEQQLQQAAQQQPQPQGGPPQQGRPVRKQ